MQFYAVRVNGKTVVLSSQSVLPIPQDLAAELSDIIADGADESVVSEAIADFMCK